jgi:AGZA family xanthine/uracil permease-like MFS transporter
VLSLFFTPLLIAVPAAATAPALVAVGALMLTGARDVDWSRFDEAVPAFLTLAGMPLTYSIANGISLGIVSWVAIKVLAGRWREVHPVLGGLAVALAAFYALR